MALKILYGHSTTSPSKSNGDSSDSSSIENECATKKSKSDEIVQPVAKAKQNFTAPRSDDDFQLKAVNPIPLQVTSNILKKTDSIKPKPAPSTVDSDLIEILDSDSNSDSDIVTLDDDEQSKAKTFYRKPTSVATNDDEETNELPDLDVNSCNQYINDDYAFDNCEIIDTNSNANASDSDELVDLSVEEPAKTTKTAKPTNYNYSENSCSSTALTQKMSVCSTATTIQKSTYAATSVASSNTMTHIDKPGSMPTTIVTFKPGTFEIILFVDNCEQSHA